MTVLVFLGPTAERCSFIRPGMPISGLEVGREYEVAEIFEDPGYLMARPLGHTQWPKPGEPRFCVAPELFEGPEEAIQILSCGYSLSTLTNDMFGIRIVGEDDLLRCRNWSDGREAHPATVPDLHQPDFLFYPDVIFPEPGHAGFLGYYYSQMVRTGLSQAAATERLSVYVGCLAGAYGHPGEVACRLWYGNGAVRLLTPVSKRRR